MSSLQAPASASVFDRYYAGEGIVSLELTTICSSEIFTEPEEAAFAGFVGIGLALSG